VFLRVAVLSNRVLIVKKITLLLLGLILTVLTACGGGGSSSSDGGSNSADGNFSVDKTNISFTGRIGNGTPEVAIINGRLTGVKEQPYILVDVSKTNLVRETYFDTTSGTEGQLLIIPEFPNNIVPGTHTGVIRVSACKDAACKKHYSGSPINISVSYTVTAPEFQVMPMSVTFEMYENQPTPEPQTLLLTSSESSNFLFGVSYFSNSNWLGATLDSFDKKIALSVTRSLPAGTHVGTAYVYAFSNLIAKPVNVTLNVNKLPVQLNNSKWDLNIDAVTFDGSEIQTIGITSAGDAVNWTANSDKDWLSVSQESGIASSTTSNFSIGVNEKILDLRSGDWVGKILFQGADLSIPPTVYTVNLKLNKPEISAIAPAVGLVGQTYKVNVYGKGIGSYLTEIRVNNQIPGSIVKLSEDTVQVDVVPFAEGDIKISVGDSLLDYPSREAIFASKSTSSNFPEAILNLADLGSRAIFDPIHEELYIVAHHPHQPYGPNTRIQKLFLQTGTWVLDDLLVANCPVNGMSISPDSSTLAVLCGQFDIVMIDTNTFSTKERIEMQSTPNISEIGGIEFQNNFEMLIATSEYLISLDLNSGAIDLIAGVNTETRFYIPKFISSADRSAIYILQTGTSLDPPMKRFDSFNRKLYQTSIDERHYGMESTSLDGKWIVLGSGLYDANLTYKASTMAYTIRQLSLSGDMGWEVDFGSYTINGYSLQNASMGNYNPIKTMPLALLGEGSLFIFTSVNNKRLFVVRGNQVGVINVE
jgi:hypothetical protein